MKSISSVRYVLQIVVFLFMASPLVSHARSAIADIPNHATESIYAAWNFPNQKDADTAALEGCRSTARASGIADLAQKCRVALRQKGEGAGALLCAENGCSFVASYPSEQEAVDAAYDNCVSAYKNCPSDNIRVWKDETGYSKKVASSSPTKACAPPSGRVVHSQTQCNNGDCIRTFENGCQVRFNAPYCFDPVSGTWSWKPDGC